jgi:phospholipid transport system substrate-binding protein
MALLLIPVMAQAAPTPPDELARQTVQKVLNDMRGQRDYLRQHPQALYHLINKDLVPLVDLPYMSQLVLGRYWRTASPSQRDRFETAFKNMLIRTYGNALLGFTDSTQIKYLPIRAPKGAQNVTFHAIITTKKGQSYHINLNLQLVSGQWKVYDASVGNLDFMINYRGQFTSQIRRKGLENVIERMEKKYNPE